MCLITHTMICLTAFRVILANLAIVYLVVFKTVQNCTFHFPVVYSVSYRTVVYIIDGKRALNFLLLRLLQDNVKDSLHRTRS